jgi:tripartite-type tricarboxylate transporter receptor subunit TctC
MREQISTISAHCTCDGSTAIDDRRSPVATARRQVVLPEIPTVGEFVPGYEASGWSGVGAPSGTPQVVIDKLNEEIKLAFADPRIGSRIAELGGVPLGNLSRRIFEPHCGRN